MSDWNVFHLFGYNLSSVVDCIACLSEFGMMSNISQNIKSKLSSY